MFLIKNSRQLQKYEIEIQKYLLNDKSVFFLLGNRFCTKSIEFIRLYVRLIGELLLNDEMEHNFYQNTHI